MGECIFELREWDKDYIASIAYHANNIKIAKNLRNVFPSPYTYEDAEYYINMCIDEGEQNQYSRAIVVDGVAVGAISLVKKNDVYVKSAELGYWLGEEFWHKGIMTQAIIQICNDGFSKYDIVRIFAEPFEFNQGSRRALEKAGFELEGILKKSIYKDGVISDSCIYSLIKEEK